MKLTDIAIHTGGIDQPYRELGEIGAKVSAGSIFSGEPTTEDVNAKLQEEAARLGANAVLYVSYDRGMSLTSYKVLKAAGLAVALQSDDMKCPFCAEQIKREAKKCKHCGSDVESVSVHR